MRSHLKQVLAAVVLPLVLGAAAAAQPHAAPVSGTVTSVDGARLPRATIIVTSDASGEQRRSASDSLGAFVVDRLPAGSYTILVEFPGLAPRLVRDVVAGAEPVRLAVVLEPLMVRETVTVSAAVPRDSVEVTDVRESPARDVGELLADSPGLWKLRKGAIASDVVLRGLQSRDLNVLIDGERLYGACPNHMDPPSFHVDFSQVERVDVGKGPFDVRYAGSLGGLVNIVTKQPEAGWNASTSLGAGSFGFVNPSTTVSYGGARMSALGGASYRRSAPYRDGRGNPMTQGAGYQSAAEDSDAFRATTVWGRAAWKPAAGHQIETSYTAQRTDHILYPYLLMDALWDNADRAAVEYSAPAMGWFSGFRAQAYWSRVAHWMTDEYRTSSSGALRSYSMGTDASTLTVGGRVEARHGATTIGGEVYRRNWNTATLTGGMAYTPQYSIPDVNIDLAGAFVEHARPLTTKVAIDIGGRLDTITSAADAAKANLALYRAYHGIDSLSRTDVTPAGRAKVSYAVGGGMSVAAAVGHTARVAEGNERFFALRRMGTDWVGNPSLDPARNTGVDLSMTLQRSRVTVTANGYVNSVHDYIAVYAAPRQVVVAGVMNAAARSYANVDARLRGFEMNGSVRLRTALTVSGDVSSVRGTMTPRPDIGVTATNLAETPPLRGRLRVRLDDGRLFGEVEGVASAAQNNVDRTLGEWTTPSYSVMNLTAGLRRGRLSATVGAANLFNRYYLEHLSFQRDPFRSGLRIAEPGRNVFTNVSWKF